MNFWILGINARNLLYIKKFNPQKQIRFVNDKYKTKEFLEQRGIPVPETYARIHTRKELAAIDFTKLPASTFVVKPNKGSQWNGISIIKNVEKIVGTASRDVLANEQNKKKEFRHWLHERIHNSIQYIYNIRKKQRDEHNAYTCHIQNQHIPEHEFKRKLSSILDGQHTLWNQPDSILVEEKLVPGQWFELFCEHGLADIRIIVFNMVPIAAMLRMPTEKSGGKANLAQGGIGFGIDVGTGKITHMAKKWGKVYIDKFPTPYQQFQKATIPFREELLLFSANAQYFLNIWYIGLDRVITNKWPKLLEVNGRTGIEIQNITQQPLRRIIDKIHDLEVPRPEKWVEIAKSLFAPEKSVQNTTKIIYLSQNAIVESSSHDMTYTAEIIAIANTKKKKNYISATIAKKLGNPKSVLLSLPDSEIKTSITIHTSEKIQGNKIELGSLFLQKYLIKPIHKSQTHREYIDPSKISEVEQDEIQILDQKIWYLHKEISLSNCVRPTNYLSELDTFISKRGKYNPIFTYTYPTNKKIYGRQSQLEKIQDAYTKNAYTSAFAHLLYDKVEELETKIQLIKAYKEQNYEKIKEYNESYFGAIEKNILKLSEKKMQEPKTRTKKEMGKKLWLYEIEEKVRKHLKKNNIEKVAIEKSSTTLSRISIVYKNDKPYIRLMSNTRCSFQEKELEAKLAHEIDIHLQRFLNARKTWRYILQQGAQWYIADEEWLAIRHSEKILKSYIPTYENRNIYKNYMYAHMAQELTFRQLADYIATQEGEDIYANKLLTLFNRTVKFKKWIQNTWFRHPWCCYLKDKVYLDGYIHIKKYVEAGNDIEDLLIGKVKVSDLDYVV